MKLKVLRTCRVQASLVGAKLTWRGAKFSPPTSVPTPHTTSEVIHFCKYSTLTLLITLDTHFSSLFITNLESDPVGIVTVGSIDLIRGYVF